MALPTNSLFYEDEIARNELAIEQMRIRLMSAKDPCLQAILKRSLTTLVEIQTVYKKTAETLSVFAILRDAPRTEKGSASSEESKSATP